MDLQISLEDSLGCYIVVAIKQLSVERFVHYLDIYVNSLVKSNNLKPLRDINLGRFALILEWRTGLENSENRDLISNAYLQALCEGDFEYFEEALLEVIEEGCTWEGAQHIIDHYNKEINSLGTKLSNRRIKTYYISVIKFIKKGAYFRIIYDEEKIKCEHRETSVEKSRRFSSYKYL